jgi:hypothetical protein
MELKLFKAGRDFGASRAASAHNLPGLVEKVVMEDKLATGQTANRGAGVRTICAIIGAVALIVLAAATVENRVENQKAVARVADLKSLRHWGDVDMALVLSYEDQEARHPEALNRLMGLHHEYEAALTALDVNNDSRPLEKFLTDASPVIDSEIEKERAQPVKPRK